MGFGYLVLAGLLRKPVRMLLTLASIVLAFLLFGLLHGIDEGAHKVLSSLNNLLYVTNKYSMSDTLPIAYADKIARIPGVKQVAHLTYFAGFYKDSRNQIPVFATNIPEFFALYKFGVSNAQLEQMQHSSTGIIVAEPLAAKYGWKIGDRVSINSSAWLTKDGGANYTFDVVGVFRSPSGSDQGLAGAAFFNYSYLDESRAFEKGRVHYFIAAISDSSLTTRTAQDIDRLFENSADTTNTQTEGSLIEDQLRQVANVKLIARFVIGAVFFTLLFVTGNTLMQSIRERLPEFAVLRAIGFSNRRVAALVLIESLVICLSGAILGLSIAEIGYFLFAEAFGPLDVPAEVIFIGLALAVVLAICSGLPPVLRVIRLQIASVLAKR